MKQYFLYLICFMLFNNMSCGYDSNENKGFGFRARAMKMCAVLAKPVTWSIGKVSEYGEGKQAKEQLVIQNKLLERCLENNPNTEFINNQLQDIGNRINIGNSKLDSIGGQVGVVEGKLDVVDGSFNQLAEDLRIRNNINMAFQVINSISSIINICEFTKRTAVGTRKWLFPTAQEKCTQKIEQLKIEDELIVLTARKEFSSCVVDNWHDSERDRTGLPHRCYSARNKFLLLKENKFKS